MGNGINAHSSLTSFTTSPPHPAEQYYRETIDCLLGEGMASIVYRAFDSKANRHIAIKKIDYSPTNSSQTQHERAHRILQAALTELRVYKRLGETQSSSTLSSAQLHPFIIQLHSAGCTESSVVYIVACIGSALSFLHQRRIIHRDVKPDNILLDQFGRPYLTDFGISIMSSGSNPLPISRSTSGTLPYVSPEALAPFNCHSFQSDFWSLGVTAYELFFHQLPFPRMCPLDMVKFVANTYHWVWPELLSKYSEASAPLPPLASLDFASIPNSDLSAELPFPDFEVTLNEDGSLPESLLVPLPAESRASELFKSLLCGLLDVRIPHRLGSMTELSEHPIFAQHCWAPFSDLSSMVSPFAGAEFLKRNTTHELKISAPSRLDRKALKKMLTPELRDMLSQFKYSPSLPSSSSVTAFRSSVAVSFSESY